MTSNDLHIAIRNTFPAPAYTYLTEVRDATGFDCVRSADGIAIGMYRTCGRLLHGFEIKVSRTDWQKELSHPAKSESLLRYCHRWALIVPDEKIVKAGELPPTWGMGVPVQSRKNALPKINWIVNPPALEPMPISMVMLTALIYSSCQAAAVPAQKALIDKYEEGRRHGKDEAERTRSESRLLQAAVLAFEKASGVRIDSYTSESSAEALGLSFNKWRESNREKNSLLLDLKGIKEYADRVQRHVNQALEGLESL